MNKSRNIIKFVSGYASTNLSIQGKGILRENR